MTAALSGLSLAQWIAIAAAAVEAAPDELALLSTLHSTFAALAADLAVNKNPQRAAAIAFFAANGGAAIKLQPGAEA